MAEMRAAARIEQRFDLVKDVEQALPFAAVLRGAGVR
jgi:hypothetical protein